MSIVAYTRVSVAEQARDGVSLESQESKVRTFCKLHDLLLVEVISDPGASGKSLDRPGLTRALAMLDEGVASGLVVAKLDRLTRSVEDFAQLVRTRFGVAGGPDLFSAGDPVDTRSATGRMSLGLMILLAQHERELLVERTQSAMNFLRSKGQRISGRLPFGSDLAADGTTLVDNPAELAALAMIRARHSEGVGARAIARELNQLAIPTKGGRPWQDSTVRALLRRPSPPLEIAS